MFSVRSSVARVVSGRVSPSLIFGSVISHEFLCATALVLLASCAVLFHFVFHESRIAVRMCVASVCPPLLGADWTMSLAFCLSASRLNRMGLLDCSWSCLGASIFRALSLPLLLGLDSRSLSWCCCLSKCCTLSHPLVTAGWGFLVPPRVA